jgi:hypothetical protein
MWFHVELEHRLTRIDFGPFSLFIRHRPGIVRESFKGEPRLSRPYIGPMAAGTIIFFGTVMILNPREAVDNPHTHQEMPVEPVMETLAPTVDTFTGNQLRMMVPIVPDQYT